MTTTASEPRVVTDDVVEAADQVLPFDRDQLEDVQRQVNDLDRKARTLIRENPVASLVVGVAAGFVIGRLLGR